MHVRLGVDLLRRHRYRAVQIVVVPTLTVLSILYVQMLKVPVPTKVALDSMILALVVIHFDLKDGGLLSRVVYSFGGSYALRGQVSVGFAFAWATAVVALAGGWGGPLMSVYMVPLGLAAIRGGLKLTLMWAAILGTGLVISFRGAWGNMSAVQAATLAMPMFTALVLGSMIGRLRRAAMDLSALYETGKAIGASLKLEETLPLVLNIVALDLHADASLLVLADEESEVVRVEAQRGLPQEVSGVALQDDDFIVDYVIGGMHSICINQKYEEPVLSIAPGFGSVLAVPLIVGGRSVGALVAGNYSEHAFSHDSIRFMEALASQAATAVDNGRLFGQAHQWAVRDGLTGLHNYRYFAERVADELARAHRYGGAVAIVMIDVDLFKRVNDTWGHLEGDEVLRQIAQLIEHETRESDIVARYGGEEFAIIMPQTNLEHATTAADKLRESVEAHSFRTVETNDIIRITVSCGVACYPETAAEDDELLRLADAALYEAKVHRNITRTARTLRSAVRPTGDDGGSKHSAGGSGRKVVSS